MYIETKEHKSEISTFYVENTLYSYNYKTRSLHDGTAVNSKLLVVKYTGSTDSSDNCKNTIPFHNTL